MMCTVRDAFVCSWWKFYIEWLVNSLQLPDLDFGTRTFCLFVCLFVVCEEERGGEWRDI